MRRLTALGAVWLILAGFGSVALAQGLPDVRLGNEAFRQGDYAAAVGHYTDAIRSGELVGEALAITYNNRGVAYGEAGDFDPAIADYSQALALRPEDATTIRNLRVAHVRRGEVSFASGAYDAAVADFTRAAELEPEHHLAYQRRGELYAELGLLDIAVEDLERAALLSPGDPEIVTALERVTEQRAAVVASVEGAVPAAEAPMPTAGGEAPPAAEEPAAEEPAAEEPAAEEPAAEEPAAEEPAAEEPVVELPQTQEPPRQSEVVAEEAVEAAEASEPAAVDAPTEEPAIALRPEPAPRVAAVEPPAVEPPAPEAPTPEAPAREPAAAPAQPERPIEVAPAAPRPAEVEPNQTTAAAGEAYRVISAVNYRAGPDNDAPRLGTVDAGRVVRVTGDTLGWKHVSLPNGDSGFIYRTWLEPVTE